MKSIRKWVRNVFGFSGNEINGFLILIPVMLLLVISEPLRHVWMAGRFGERKVVPVDSLEALWGDLAGQKTVARPAALFHFDPNTATVEDLTKLGFTPGSSTRIAAYRQKGGVFRIKSDLLKIYGLDSALYDQLYGYIALPVDPVRRDRATHFPPDGSTVHNRPRYEPSSRGEKKQKFDINTADTLQLKSVYGIGSKLAARIVKFRDGLGGFVNQDQLFEVYGLDSATVVRLLSAGFISPDFAPRRINVNTANAEMLSAHPYINYQLARLLVSYRFQHGDFTDVNDIKKLSIIKQHDVERLLPYLEAGN